MLTPQEALIELNGKLERVLDAVHTIREKHDDMAQHLEQIRDAVYEPDEGLYVRLRELESWKNSSSKLLWMIMGGLVSVGAAMWIQYLN
jgi:hypothetical protein